MEIKVEIDGEEFEGRIHRTKDVSDGWNNSIKEEYNIPKNFDVPKGHSIETDWRKFMDSQHGFPHLKYYKQYFFPYNVAFVEIERLKEEVKDLRNILCGLLKK